MDFPFDDIASYYFQIADNIPPTNIINETKMNATPSTVLDMSFTDTPRTSAKSTPVSDAKYNFNEMAYAIYQKYIADQSCHNDLCINISYQQRQTLKAIDFETADILALYVVFDEVFIEMIRLLLSPFGRFSKSDNYGQWLRNQENNKKEA
eukprot:268916_1